MTRSAACLLLAGAALCGAAPSFAAGGHHSVDDAAVLKQGECEAESWFTRSDDRDRLLHAGLNCGLLGWLELGAASEYARDATNASQTAWGLQAKVAHAVSDSFSIGAVILPAWQARTHPHYAGSTLLALATWSVHETVAVHLNLGMDFVHQGADSNRGGISAEWSPAPAWSLVAERYKEQDTHFARGGVRWLPAEGWQVDHSRAHRVSGPNPSQWTVGLTYSWD